MHLCLHFLNQSTFGIQKLYIPNKVQLNFFTLVGNYLNFSFCRPSDNHLIRTSSENMQTIRTSPISIVGNLGITADRKPANLYFIIFLCQAIRTYWRNLGLFGLFRSQNLPKMLQQVRQFIHRTARDVSSLIARHVSLHELLASQMA